MGGSRSDVKMAGRGLIFAAAVLCGWMLWGATGCKQKPADVSLFRERGCTSCHIEGARVGPVETCTGCHVRRGIRARGEKGPGALYGTAPSLTMLAGLEPKKFTAEGLTRFLAVPEARMSRTASMFPLHGEDAGAARELLAMRPEGRLSGSWQPDLILQGQVLYERLGCRSCHEDARMGPRLRLGYPLLSAAFFAGKLRDPRFAPWPGEHAQVMPAFPSLSDRDIDALYAYISSTRDQAELRPLQSAAPLSVSSVLLDSHLYDFVAGALVQASCRHCHSTAPATRREMRAIFPGVASGFGIERTGGALGFAAASAAILSPGPGCSESPLVHRLRARRQEWAGARTEVRGMPLTLAPLAADTIRIIDIWTKRGCPSPQGNLCRKCDRLGAGR